MDRFDLAILDVIQGNAGLSVAEVAEKVSISKSACWRRIQKLEKEGVICERVTLINPQSVNLSLTVYISVRTDQHNDSWAESFSQIVGALPQVLEVHRMSGDLDYLIKAVVADMHGYDQLYKEIIKANIFDVSASFVMETKKHTTQLPLYVASEKAQK